MQPLEKPSPSCPVCRRGMTPAWFKIFPKNNGFTGVFICRECLVRWRLTQSSDNGHIGKRTLRDFTPICPTCKHAPVDMTAHQVDERGRPVSWVCWEDGTILRRFGNHLVVEPIHVRNAV
jgi:hypothetical protein